MWNICLNAAIVRQNERKQSGTRDIRQFGTTRKRQKKNRRIVQNTHHIQPVFQQQTLYRNGYLTKNTQQPKNRNRREISTPLQLH